MGSVADIGEKHSLAPYSHEFERVHGLKNEHDGELAEKFAVPVGAVHYTKIKDMVNQTIT